MPEQGEEEESETPPYTKRVNKLLPHHWFPHHGIQMPLILGIMGL